MKHIAEAIKARVHRVHIAKVPAHVGLHGNEVADSIAKWATDAASAATELGSHLVHLSGTDSVHPRGIGLACPWEVVSPSIRRAACVETLSPVQGVKGASFDMFNCKAMRDRLARANFEQTLLKPGKLCPWRFPGRRPASP